MANVHNRRQIYTGICIFLKESSAHTFLEILIIYLRLVYPITFSSTRLLHFGNVSSYPLRFVLDIHPMRKNTTKNQFLGLFC